MGAKLLLSCLTLCDSLYYSPPGSSVCGILQARSILASRSGLPCPSPGDLPYPGIELVSLTSPPLADGSLPLVPPGLIGNSISSHWENGERRRFYLIQAKKSYVNN